MYVYSRQVHRSTGEAPVILKLTGIHPEPASGHIPLVIPITSTTTTSLKLKMLHIHHGISLKITTADNSHNASQERFKKYFDKSLQILPTIMAGKHVYTNEPPMQKTNKEKDQETK